MATVQLPIPREEIAAFCKRWDVAEFSLFGSVLRTDFRPDSDVDVLVTFSEGAEISLFDLVQLKLELEEIFHRSVDVIEKDTLENPFRKREILKTAQVIYAVQWERFVLFVGYVQIHLGNRRNYQWVPHAKFVENKTVRYALERLLLIIGEAANHISKEFQDGHPNIE